MGKCPERGEGAVTSRWDELRKLESLLFKDSLELGQGCEAFA